MIVANAIIKSLQNDCQLGYTAAGFHFKNPTMRASFVDQKWPNYRSARRSFMVLSLIRCDCINVWSYESTLSANESIYVQHDYYLFIKIYFNY